MSQNDKTNPEFAILANIMNKLQSRNEELRAKELRLRKQLQETKQRVAKRARSKTPPSRQVYSETESESSYDEETVECPRKCWRSPLPIETSDSEAWTETSSVCSDVDVAECPYRPAVVPSDISINVTPSPSESTSVGSLQSEDMMYLQQLEAIAADERERIERLAKLKRRERDIMRTAEVTRAVVDELQEIFNEGVSPKRRWCREDKSFPTTPVPPSTPVHHPIPLVIPQPDTSVVHPPSVQVPPPVEVLPPESKRFTESCTEAIVESSPSDSRNSSLHSESMNIWAQTIAQNERIKEVISKHRVESMTPVSSDTSERPRHASSTSRGQTTPKATVYVPTKTDYRVLQNDDPFRVASKVSRVPSLNLHNIPESRQHTPRTSDDMPHLEMKTIMDILGGEKITPENAPLVCQNISDTKRRLSFMIEHSNECKNCEGLIKDHLKAIDQQLTTLSHEFEMQHFSGPVPGSETKNSIKPIPRPASVSETSALGPTSTNLTKDRELHLVTEFGESVVSDVTVNGPDSMSTILRHGAGHRSIDSTWIDAANMKSQPSGMTQEPRSSYKASTYMDINFLEGGVSTTAPPVQPDRDELNVTPYTAQVSSQPDQPLSTDLKKESDITLTFETKTYEIEQEDKPPLKEETADIESIFEESSGTEPLSSDNPMVDKMMQTIKDTLESAKQTATVVRTTDEAEEAVITEVTRQPDQPLSTDLKKESDFTLTFVTNEINQEDKPPLNTKTADIESIFEESSPEQTDANLLSKDEAEISDAITKVTRQPDQPLSTDLKKESDITLTFVTKTNEINPEDKPPLNTETADIESLFGESSPEQTDANLMSTDEAEIPDAITKVSSQPDQPVSTDLKNESDITLTFETKTYEIDQEDKPPLNTETADIESLFDVADDEGKLNAQLVSDVVHTSRVFHLAHAAEDTASFVETTEVTEVTEISESAVGLLKEVKSANSDEAEVFHDALGTIVEETQSAELAALAKAEASHKTIRLEPETAEPARTTPEEEAEIAFLQQVFLDQTKQIRTLLDLVKQFPILKPADLCVCGPCKGNGNLKLEVVQKAINDLQDVVNNTPL